MADIKETLGAWQHRNDPERASTNSVGPQSTQGKWKSRARGLKKNIQGEFQKIPKTIDEKIKQKQGDNYDPEKSYSSQWNELKGIKKQLKGIKSGRFGKEEAEEALKMAHRAGTYVLYDLAWKNLIDSYGLTFLYLIYHNFMKYFVHSDKFCHFVNVLAEPKSMALKVSTGADSMDYLWIIIYWIILLILCFLSLLAFFMAILPIIIAMTIFM